MISVYQEDCSTHEVHRWQNYDCRSLFGCMEQTEDWNCRMKDDGWSVLTPVRSRLVYTAESRSVLTLVNQNGCLERHLLSDWPTYVKHTCT